MLYVPTVMLYFVGVSVYVLGPTHLGLADNKVFASTTSLILLALLTLLNIVGLGVGKWINNLGAIGTFIAAAVLIGLGIVIWSRFGTTITVADFKIPADPRFVLNSFGVICFGLVGLELASVMGDEIQDPRRTLPGAVAWGGVISGVLYVGATLTLLIAVGKNVNVLQGIVQAVSHMAASIGLGWIIIPFALMLSLSIAGIGSAWMGGSARIPFVAGLDSYMPSWLGKIHPRYATPYAALIVQGIVSALLVLGNFFGWWFWDKLMGADRIAPALVPQPGRRRRSLPEATFLSCRSSAGSVPLYVRRAHSICPERIRTSGPVQPRHNVSCRHQRPVHYGARHRAGIFPGPADHLAVVLRIMDVRRHSILCRPRRFFLLCLRPPQRFERAQLQPRCAWTRTGAALAAGDNQIRTRTRLQSCH